MKTITAADLANCKIRVTPEQSKKVRDLALNLGFRNTVLTIPEEFDSMAFTDDVIFYGLHQTCKFDREITYADLFPEKAEPITPEALEKEDWSELKDYHVGQDYWQEFLNGPVQASFKNGQFFSAIIRTRHTSYDTPIKGVTTMTELRLLTTLINGKA